MSTQFKTRLNKHFYFYKNYNRHLYGNMAEKSKTNKTTNIPVQKKYIFIRF